MVILFFAASFLSGVTLRAGFTNRELETTTRGVGFMIRWAARAIPIRLLAGKAGVLIRHNERVGRNLSR